MEYPTDKDYQSFRKKWLMQFVTRSPLSKYFPQTKYDIHTHLTFPSFDPVTTEKIAITLSPTQTLAHWTSFPKTTLLTLLVCSMLSNSRLQSLPLCWHFPNCSKICSCSIPHTKKTLTGHLLSKHHMTHLFAPIYFQTSRMPSLQPSEPPTHC